MVETSTAPQGAYYSGESHDPEVLHVISNRMIGKNPAGGMSEAVNQALSAVNGESNGGSYTTEIPEIKIWTGWDGKRRKRQPRKTYERKTVITPTGTSYETIGIPLFEDEYDNYYLGYSNKVIWPLNHDYPDKCHFDSEEIERYWEAYKAVNRKDATIIAETILRMAEENPSYRPLVWYQDYHKILGAKYLREELRQKGMPDEQMPPMALFMHTPIATREDFSLLPENQIQELLEGYLSFDLVGFHTEEYLHDFKLTVLRFRQFLPGVEVLDTPDGLSVTYNGRRTIVGTFPIGIDQKFLNDQAGHRSVIRDARKIREGLGDKKMIFNAARRDYMKGFPEALDAIRDLFTYHPQVREHVVYVQGDQPTRGGIEEYDEIKPIIDTKVNDISNQFKTDGWVPIERYVKGFTRPLMLSRLKQTDILFVSSTRDGFCLVPLEFMELNERNGVAVVSDRIGAASIYDEAMLTVDISNPKATAKILNYAYNMKEQERIDMLERGRSLIRENNVHVWAGKQLDFMRRIRTGRLAA